MIAAPDFAAELLRVLDAHLLKQEKARWAVSRLATGAAFETWLAFEARLLVEDRRRVFGLAPRSRPEHQWLANEFRNVDLFVGEAEETCIGAVEFKLIYNNKNWPTQVAGIYRDLFPLPASIKGQLKPRVGRFAIVGLVGKLHVERPRRGGWTKELGHWETTVWEHLLAPGRGRRIRRVAEGRRHQLQSDLLEEGFFQLYALSGG